MGQNRVSKLLVVSAMCLATFVAFGQETHRRIVTVTPVEICTPLVNPDQGWGIWAGPRNFNNGKSMSLEDNTTAFGDDARLFGWILLDWMWAELEPEEGNYKVSAT